LWLVGLILDYGAALGIVLGLSIQKPLNGLLLGIAGGWFVSWIVGIGFEELEYPLWGIIRDRGGDVSLTQQTRSADEPQRLKVRQAAPSATDLLLFCQTQSTGP
jgi:hypothetical protein